jgi:dTDP-4-dehydrorhamnose reductase
MKKILIFGSNGMFGHVIFNYLSATQRYHVIGSARSDNQLNSYYRIDVLDQSKVEIFLREVRPDIVINCAGILIEGSEKKIEDAILVNSFFPHLLSRLGCEINYKLIHISTDCVFSGKKGDYTESCYPDGVSMYARTKALGEVINQTDLIVRTSAIGPEIRIGGNSLFSWFLRQKGEIRGFTKAFWTGVTTLELAKGIDSFITQELSGIFHFVPNEKISKYDLLILMKKVWEKKDIHICPHSDYKTDKSLLNHRTDLVFSIKSYEKMFRELREYIIVNQALYPEAQYS